MTFSDPKVKRLLRKRLVCAWMDTTGDPNAGSSFSHAPGTPAGTCLRGNGEHNIQLITMTPEGRIFHALSGYVGPAELVKELEFALLVFASLHDPGRLSPEERVKAAHRDFLAAIDREERERKKGEATEATERAEEIRRVAGASFLRAAERRRVRADHRFVIRHPLLPVASFKPEMLVGNAKTFFGTSSGGVPGETIGDQSARELLKELRERFPDLPDESGK